jgi:hypothetical protein
VIGRGRLTELRREMAVNEDGLVELLDAIEVVREQLISAQAASRASWQSRCWQRSAGWTNAGRATGATNATIGHPIATSIQ